MSTEMQQIISQELKLGKMLVSSHYLLSLSFNPNYMYFAFYFYECALQSSNFVPSTACLFLFVMQLKIKLNYARFIDKQTQQSNKICLYNRFTMLVFFVLFRSYLCPIRCHLYPLLTALGFFLPLYLGPICVQFKSHQGLFYFIQVLFVPVLTILG